MHVETVNDVRASVVAELAAELAGETVQQQEAPAEAAEQEIPEGEGSEDNGDGPEEATEAEATEEETDPDADQDGPDEPVIDPPTFWSKDEKEKFSSLPRDMQELVKAKFDDNQRHVERQKTEAAEARKAAAKEAEALAAIAERVESAATAAEARFGDKWGNATPDAWAKLARENPAEYTQLKAEYDADQYAMQQATAAREATERVNREEWVKTEGERLKTLVPQLFGPEGKKVGEELKGYLIEGGAAEQDLSDLSAVAWQMAYKAMQYDKAQKSRPIQKKTVATALPSKSAPPPRATVQQAERKVIEQKAHGSNGQRPDRAAMAQLLIKDGYV